ncbi:DNA repair protein RecO [Rhodobaculum claviforme]|uniref:DNA repair protein RecO n=1 Tax=Rhodobaculum claviforme TaxID=1549854 RepID=A0A934WKA9_9RHOB|nr:DNA repair protein RecO [Rhodobaculum claviforme]MBK5928679.1 DNA repair protein RecO [Rhodobaculum claviforme]
MEWRAQALLIAVRPHGETAAIAEVFTEAHGRHAGVVRGGAGRRMAPLLQPGAELDVTWRARLEGQIGTFAVEPVRGRAGAVMGDRAALAGLSAVCALLAHVLPDRAPHPRLWAASRTLLDALEGVPDWPAAYLRWELGLLDEMGYGLDLSRCAVTGTRSGLAFVSPRTGRAVSAAGAGDWADRLLPLPPCLLGLAEARGEQLLTGLALTGYFLERHFAPEGAAPLPPARDRLVAALARRVRASSPPPAGSVPGA